MAKESTLVVDSYEASADLSASQFKLVELDSNGRVAITNASTDQSIGVLQNKPNALGVASEVGLLNGSARLKVVAGAAVAIGAVLMADTSGRAVTGTTTNRRVGIALTAAGAAGELLEMNGTGAGIVL